MNKWIFKALVGSRAYGTAIENSDFDYKGVYVQPDDEILSFRYKPQIEIGKDEAYYEIRRFLELASTANPTMLELMFIPQGNISDKYFISPAWMPVHRNRHKFLTKKCRKSFGGYAVEQINKARGLNKKMNWEKAKVERKTVLDFCYVHLEGKSIPVKKWLKDENKDQKYCGLVGLNRMQNCYSLYYDHVMQHIEELGKPNRNVVTMDFKGIAGEDSNDIRLSSVPQYLKPEVVLFFGKEAYSTHCKDYREYQAWLKNRNTQRYVDIEGHGQKIDGKNLLHCRRLIDCGLEIATEGTLTVRRKNAEELLKVRRGEVSLEEIIKKAEEDLIKMDEAFASSNLPDDVDQDFLNNIILDVRRIHRKTAESC